MGYSKLAMFAGVFEMVARGVTGLVLVPAFGFYRCLLCQPDCLDHGGFIPDPRLPQGDETSAPLGKVTALQAVTEQFKPDGLAFTWK